MPSKFDAAISRPSRLVVLVATMVVTLTWLAITASARATCFSSTPASSTFSDMSGDAPGAPDISQVSVALDAGCSAAFNPAVDGLFADEAVFTYINTDGNALTGDTGVGGADVAVGVLGPSGVYPPLLGGWNGVNYDFSQPLPAIGTAGFTTTLDQLGVTAPTVLGVKVGSVHSDVNYTAIDDAPDGTGTAYAWSVTFSTTPPPPPPSPPSSPASPPPAPTKVQAKKCTVPNLKGNSLSKAKRRLKQARCKFKISGKGKVVSTNPSAGSKTSGTVQVKAKKKTSKKHRARALAAIVTLRSLERAMHKATGGGNR